MTGPAALNTAGPCLDLTRGEVNLLQSTSRNPCKGRPIRQRSGTLRGTLSLLCLQKELQNALPSLGLSGRPSPLFSPFQGRGPDEAISGQVRAGVGAPRPDLKIARTGRRRVKDSTVRSSATQRALRCFARQDNRVNLRGRGLLAETVLGGERPTGGSRRGYRRDPLTDEHSRQKRWDQDHESLPHVSKKREAGLLAARVHVGINLLGQVAGGDGIGH